MTQRTLVLGSMPASATPQTHVPAGVWCFAGCEEHWPQWETAFTFAPDPLTAPHALDAAAREATGLTAHYVPRVAEHLRPNHDLPPVYWEVALSSWLMMVAQLVVGYQHRAQSLIAAYGEQEMLVPVLPEQCPFHFATEQDFIMGGSLNAVYTHWLLSCILRTQWPTAWRAQLLPVPEADSLRHPVQPRSAPTGLAGIKHRLRLAAQQSLLHLPFPKIRGFSLRQSLCFSRALRGNTNQADNSRSLAPLAPHAPQLPFDPMPIFVRSLPQSLRTAHYPTHIQKARTKRTRVASIVAYEDTAYRLRLAAWRAAGHKLLFLQHGGNYGQVRTGGFTPLLEYTQHAFITWGWREQGAQQGHFVPLPAALLQGARDAHHEEDARLLYVGTEISVFPYRMDSRPTPAQYMGYRAAKADFFRALPEALHERCQYRPYFAVPGTLQDAEWLFPRFPKLTLCTGPLEKHMFGCRLLVLDHHGTTLLQALAADIPTVIFWDKAAWALCPQAEALLLRLAAAGIWFATPQEAAAHIAAVWDDVPAWWRSPDVRQAREAWCAQYARTSATAIEPLWQETLQKI